VTSRGPSSPPGRRRSSPHTLTFSSFAHLTHRPSYPKEATPPPFGNGTLVFIYERGLSLEALSTLPSGYRNTLVNGGPPPDNFCFPSTLSLPLVLASPNWSRRAINFAGLLELCYPSGPFPLRLFTHHFPSLSYELLSPICLASFPRPPGATGIAILKTIPFSQLLVICWSSFSF